VLPASKHVTDRTALLKGLRVFGIMDENMFIIFALWILD